MNTMSYTQAQLEARQQEGVEARQKALEADPAVQSTRRTLEKATADLESLQGYVKGLPLAQRVGYNGNIAQAKEAVTAAEKAVRTATNQHVRRDYLAGLQEKKQAEQQQREAERAQFALEQEAEAKRAYKPHFLAVGGTEADFEQSWPERWKRELDDRSTAQMAATQRSLKQAHAYTL